MENFNESNPNYIKNKNKKVRFNLNQKNKSSSLDFDNDYASKVRTILNKNIISRYKNSPFSL